MLASSACMVGKTTHRAQARAAAVAPVHMPRHDRASSPPGRHRVSWAGTPGGFGGPGGLRTIRNIRRNRSLPGLARPTMSDHRHLTSSGETVTTDPSIVNNIVTQRGTRKVRLMNIERVASELSFKISEMFQAIEG